MGEGPGVGEGGGDILWVPQVKKKNMVAVVRVIGGGCGRLALWRFRLTRAALRVRVAAGA